MNIFLVLIVAISLSMDAFSLSLLYGTLGMNKNEKFFLALITGVFHFFMPLFGYLLGSFLFKYFEVDSNFFVGVILSFIGGQMFFSSFKNEDVHKLDLGGYFLFALAVSVDSFSVGITLSNISNIVLGPLIFALSSFIFTFFGLYLGDKIEKLFGKISTIVGGVILVIIGLDYLF